MCGGNARRALSTAYPPAHHVETRARARRVRPSSQEASRGGTISLRHLGLQGHTLKVDVRQPESLLANKGVGHRAAGGNSSASSPIASAAGLSVCSNSKYSKRKERCVRRRRYSSAKRSFDILRLIRLELHRRTRCSCDPSCSRCVHRAHRHMNALRAVDLELGIRRWRWRHLAVFRVPYAQQGLPGRALEDVSGTGGTLIPIPGNSYWTLRGTVIEDGTRSSANGSGATSDGVHAVTLNVRRVRTAANVRAAKFRRPARVTHAPQTGRNHRDIGHRRGRWKPGRFWERSRGELSAPRVLEMNTSWTEVGYSVACA
ncbi:hypothetical protein C8Q77DRAFT_687504 [Trametes polyzona]|nr:hypothetical protein C8Q77DRAFT_687504 [Trametes polyzona]